MKSFIAMIGLLSVVSTWGASSKSALFITANDTLFEYQSRSGEFSSVAFAPGATIGSYEDALVSGENGMLYNQAISGIWRWDIKTRSGAMAISFGSEVTTAPGGFALGPQGTVFVTSDNSLLLYDLNSASFIGVVATGAGSTVGSYSDHVVFGPDGGVYNLNVGGIWRWDLFRRSGSQFITFGEELTVAPGGFAFGSGGVYVTADNALLQYDSRSAAFLGVVAAAAGSTVGSYSDNTTAGPDGAIYNQCTGGIWRWDLTSRSGQQVVTFGANITGAPGGFAFLTKR